MEGDILARSELSLALRSS